MTGFDLRWLDATDAQVRDGAAQVDEESRIQAVRWGRDAVRYQVPAIVERRNLRTAVHGLAMLLVAVIGMVIVQLRSEGRPPGHGLVAADLPYLVVPAAVLVLWIVIAVLLARAHRRRRERTALQTADREMLVAGANGCRLAGDTAPAVEASIAATEYHACGAPRFVAVDGAEFGNLSWQRSPTQWHYVMARLPAPLPHLVLDATANDTVVSDLPESMRGDQRLSLEGDFDRHFRLYAPAEYRDDALYVLTPDVMAVLVDGAAAYNVEIVDDTVFFFVSPAADFTTPAPWRAVEHVLSRVVPALAERARRYHDDHVAGQDAPRLAPAGRTLRTGDLKHELRLARSTWFYLRWLAVIGLYAMGGAALLGGILIIAGRDG